MLEWCGCRVADVGGSVVGSKGGEGVWDVGMEVEGDEGRGGRELRGGWLGVCVGRGRVGVEG